MKVEGVTITPDAYRQSQFYAGTHLSLYHINREQKQQTESQSFERSAELAVEKLHVKQTLSMKEKQFLKLREEHANREEAFQRLAYKNGVNFSTDQQLYLIEHLNL